jgi:thymidylate kinase
VNAVEAAVNLFPALDVAGARYVHWKSNEHLQPALAAETDLDILFDRGQYRLVRRVLDECGFKPFLATARTGYPGIEDHFALDPATGRLVHCHAHFLLSAGARYLKGHRIPWEERFLATSREDPSTGVRIADPNLELLTLLIRAAMKLRTRDRLATIFGRQGFRGGTLREYEWLLERADQKETVALAHELLGPGAARVVEQLLDHPPRDSDIRRLRRAARPTVDEWRTRRGGFPALQEVWSRELHAARTALNRRTLHRAKPGRRVVPGGGILIAFMGADGSGKSTVVEAVSDRLARKIDVLRLYMGSGDGPVSLLRSPLKPLAKAVRRTRRPGDGGGAGSASIRRDSTPILAGRILWALSLSREKRQRLEAAWRARNRGMIVVTDRYPQAQIPGFNDGPLLRARAESGGRLLQHAATAEERAYLLAERQAPDLVVRLRVTPEVAIARKPDMTATEIARRDKAIGSMSWGDETRVVDVDASQPLDEVIRQVLLAIWEEI